MTKIGKIKTIKKLGMRCMSCFLPFVLENLNEQLKKLGKKRNNNKKDKKNERPINTK